MRLNVFRQKVNIIRLMMKNDGIAEKEIKIMIEDEDGANRRTIKNVEIKETGDHSWILIIR